jgi:hypothetical protein
VPRYVVLEHESPRGLHWDFMLECGDALAAWALASPPDAAHAVDAAALPDHRIAYLDYEGPISGRRGSVRQWDRGEYACVARRDDCIVAELTGSRLNGRVVLARRPQSPGDWSFTFQRSAPHRTSQ